MHKEGKISFVRHTSQSGESYPIPTDPKHIDDLLRAVVEKLPETILAYENRHALPEQLTAEAVYIIEYLRALSQSDQFRDYLKRFPTDPSPSSEAFPVHSTDLFQDDTQV